MGAASGIARAVFVDDLVTRVEPMRTRILAAADRPDPFASRRAAELEVVDGRFANNRMTTLVHVVGGSLFLLLAPFQFSRRIRGTYLAFHRWSGRFLVATGILMAIAGLYFGLFMPYGGLGEALAISGAGGLFLFAIVRAFLAIRQKDIARHRVWMTRAFGVGIGITVVRFAAGLFDFWLTPQGFTPATIFVFSLWTGFGLSVTVTELWFAHTRRNEQSFAG